MPQPSLESLLKTSYLSGGSAGYLEDLYEQYLKDPNAVEPRWRDYFQSLPQVNGLGTTDISHADIREEFAQLAKRRRTAVAATSGDALHERQQAAVNELIQAYQTYGHIAAHINPLQTTAPAQPTELKLSTYPDLATADPKQTFQAQGAALSGQLTLPAITNQLHEIYCGGIGAEFMYISNAEERTWIAQQLAKKPQQVLSADEKKQVLQQLIAADGLEKFLSVKYVGQKRFSLEGGDGFIPMLHAINERATTHDVQEVIIGMAHRGRLSTLINVMGRPSALLFEEFEGRKDFHGTSGDVKYHVGYAADVPTANGDLHLAMMFNPSHLEIVAATMMGATRARQQHRASDKRHQVLGIAVHGDASVAGQGVVMETFSMSQTRAYHVGGIIHIVINNQVGFTTSNPKDARSSRYCTDIAKMIEVPVLHVNGDDAEAVIFAARFAVDYRARFQKDVVIDLVCYRRLGHNEADEPAATQPLMYQFIRQHPHPRELYAQRLIQEKVCTQEDVDAMITAYRDTLDASKQVVPSHAGALTQYYTKQWQGYVGNTWADDTNTSVTKEQLLALGKKLQALPEGFEMQRQVGLVMAARNKMLAGEAPLDWGCAEILAYATLLDAGYPVRMTGEDCRRGTFSHRHAALHNQKTGQAYMPLQHLNPKQANIEVYDSLLSEMGTMGFEYGYSGDAPKTLTLWEAQYGDFANTAQTVIDQFISAAWQKWETQSGLTLLLPHGHEGGGPEHTSARLERYLQLCAEDNMQVCMPTTPAQIFHLLRRQALQRYRIPLVVMSPKSLLRHKLATSTLDELANGKFQLVIGEVDDIPKDKVTRVVLCSGKVYYDLVTRRREQKLNRVAIVRVEQLYPFPTEMVQAQLKAYKNAKEVVWCQEEPQNQGSWYTLRDRLEACLQKGQQLQYVGRPAMASTAAGYGKLHEQQQAELVQKAIA